MQRPTELIQMIVASMRIGNTTTLDRSESNALIDWIDQIEQERDLERWWRIFYQGCLVLLFMIGLVLLGREALWIYG